MTLPAVTATGRLGANPELRYTQAGHPVASLRIACTERRRQQDGTWEDGATTWLDVTTWRNLAEAAAEHLTKGDLVTVTGRLTQREHDGTTYYGITADTIAKGLTGTRTPTQRTHGGQTPSEAWGAQQHLDPWATPATPTHDEPPF